MTPGSVFLSLGETLRTELLAYRSIDASPAVLGGDFDALKRDQKRNLDQDLICIATLGSEPAAQLVHDFLTEAGWARCEFDASRSTRDRACALLCHFADHFDDALAIWNGNRLRWSMDREQGFKLPGLKDYQHTPLSETEEARLKGLIEYAFAESYPNKTISRVRLFGRTARGLLTPSASVLQCDISLGDDPESIEIIDQGEETVISISRLSRISVIIDPQGGTLFVGTQLGKKKLHAAIAQCLVQVLFGQGAPERLSALRVFPDRCKTAVTFAYSVEDGIGRPCISELRYRLYGASNSLNFSVRDDAPESAIHDHPEVRRLAKRMRVWRAVIDFTFWYHDGERPVRRSVALSEPGTISFGKAFPEERVIIERVLTESGLIDPAYDWSQRARFSDIARLVVPQHVAELRRSWLPVTVNALIKADILRKGEPHPRAWCDICGETHDVARKQSGDLSKLVVMCPHDQRALKPEDVDTLVLSTDGLLNWLRLNAIEGNRPWSAIGGTGQAWLLGPALRKKKTSAYQLVLAVDVDQPKVMRDLNSYLMRFASDQRGLILALTDNPIQKEFPHGWRTAPLHEVCEITKRGLIYNPKRAAAALTGKKAEKSAKTEEDWNEVFAFFEEAYPGQDILQPYPVANDMIAAQPELCNVTRRTLVDRLKGRYPARFSAG